MFNNGQYNFLMEKQNYWMRSSHSGSTTNMGFALPVPLNSPLLARYEPNYQVLQHQVQHWQQNVVTQEQVAAGSSNQMVAISGNRLAGMESTIRHLQKLVIRSSEEEDNLKQKLEVVQVEKNKLVEQLSTFKDEKLKCHTEASETMDSISKANKELADTRKELLDARKEIVSAQKDVKEIVSLNKLLESREKELLKELEIMKLDALHVPSKNPQLCETEELISLKMKCSQLSKDLEVTSNSYSVLQAEFKELAKKHLYIISFSGNQMYSEYKQEMTGYVRRLEATSVTNSFQKQKLQCTFECIMKQLDLIEECRQELEDTIDTLMKRIDSGVIEVCDLNIRPRQPQFEMIGANFDQLLQAIHSIGSS